MTRIQEPPRHDSQRRLETRQILLYGPTIMDLNALLVRYFGTDDLDQADGAMVEVGLERIAVDFGMERDRGRRFGLWAVMHLLGVAPDLDVAFKDPADRDAARSLMDLADRTRDGAGAPP